MTSSDTDIGVRGVSPVGGKVEELYGGKDLRKR